MHELSVARRLVSIALYEAKRHNAKRVSQIRLVLGRLSLVRREQLVFWFRMLSEGTPLEGAELLIEEEPGEVECPSCGYRGPIRIVDDPAWHISFPTLTCPRCGSTVRVVAGRDCYIKSLRLIRQQGTANKGP